MVMAASLAVILGITPYSTAQETRERGQRSDAQRMQVVPPAASLAVAINAGQMVIYQGLSSQQGRQDQQQGGRQQQQGRQDQSQQQGERQEGRIRWQAQYEEGQQLFTSYREQPGSAEFLTAGTQYLESLKTAIQETQGSQRSQSLNDGGVKVRQVTQKEGQEQGRRDQDPRSPRLVLQVNALVSQALNAFIVANTDALSQPQEGAQRQQSQSQVREKAQRLITTSMEGIRALGQGNEATSPTVRNLTQQAQQLVTQIQAHSRQQSNSQ